MRASFFTAILLVLLCYHTNAADEQCDAPTASADAKTKYDKCIDDQGGAGFGNWKDTQRCVGEFKKECLAIEGDEVKFCSVTRATKFQAGACLLIGCPEGNCTGPFECTGTKEVLRELFGTLDEEEDTIDCCEAGDKDCNASVGKRASLIVLSLLLAVIIF
mmetsp:Transcript_10497/g.15960  ORF Transcript_10497/g.15960 Transcript_10497/m.15960 type:complete len:161 (-) Transcript_10497:102-584(-)